MQTKPRSEAQARPPEPGPGPQVVICGTFHRAAPQLRADARELVRTGCTLISPLDLRFVDESEEFVRAAHEIDRSVGQIEEGHLRALAQADFIWLHCPDGYVGLSASMELGFARSLQVPVFASREPSDLTLALLVEVCSSPSEAVHRHVAGGRKPPSDSLRMMQAYYQSIAQERGYESESAQDCLLLLMEEVGELARSVRKMAGLAREGSFPEEEPALEIADIQLYVLHLSNILGVDLADAIADKERINNERFRSRSARRSA